MAYRKITVSEKEYYMDIRGKGETQVSSAKRSGISERTGRRIENQILSTTTNNVGKKRTRDDPFSSVWDQDIVPLLELSCDLKPIVILEELQEKYPGQYPNSSLRTLQRRVKEWKSLYGDDKDVIFRQTHLPGALGISDFTELNDIKITIKGVLLCHRYYHFRLVFSGWSYVKVILGGESFTALAEGLQSALHAAGGSPLAHRTDSLSAAYKNQLEEDDLTENYGNFCKHYNMVATRNNKGVSHENGAIESSHGHLKRRVRQALLIRQSNDFESLKSYEDFIFRIVSKRNNNCKAKMIQEIASLHPLPDHKAQDYTVEHIIVTSRSTIMVKRVLYTVPSRLIGERINVHVFDDRLEIYCGGTQTLTLARIRSKNSERVHVINYRHIICSLVQKPQAFRSFVWREQLLPSSDYKEIWRVADNCMGAKQACKYIVNLLFLASKNDANLESSLARYVLGYVNEYNKLPAIEQCMERFNGSPPKKASCVVKSQDPRPDIYNDLLEIKNIEGIYYVS